MLPELKQKVDVGGAVGEISGISPTEVLVEGAFYYSDGAEGAYKEPWLFIYDRQLFCSSRWDGKHWDMSAVKAKTE